VEPKRLARRLPAILLAGWVMPGLSHALIGQRRKGLYIGLLLVGTFVAGLALGDFRCVSWERHPLTFVGQTGMGGLFLVGWGLAAHLPTPPTPARLESLGLLYSAVAALLNWLVVIDVYERVARMNLPPAPAPKAASKP